MEWHVNPLDPSSVMRGGRTALIALRDPQAASWREATDRMSAEAEAAARALNWHGRLLALLARVVAEDEDNDMVCQTTIEEIEAALREARP